ncbi:restriction endonuclease [Rhizorhabdus wittichii]|uniref:restriction endonuclease n=1 Tax=Rhizorhabdus wittichii TaxID=160791 RepID=UPI0002F16B25|nr:restriction endonuclease [Rhizorhabdus wittichii]
MTPDSATAFRYVKLGPSGGWVDAALQEGRLYFGDFRTDADPNELAARGDWGGVHGAYLHMGKKPAQATADTTEIRTFYEIDQHCLWITFARGRLWWGFAEEDVHTLAERQADGRHYYRDIIGGWRCTDILDAPLQIDRLSSRLTQLASYRRTICRVTEEGYLRRILNAEADPLITTAQKRLGGLAEALEPIIAQLHWADFELFLDLLLARRGWRRVGRLGGVQADIDILLELPATGERLAVQAKSKIDAAAARAVAERLHSLDVAERLLIASHSPLGLIEEEDGVEFWGGPKLAGLAASEGLTDWLIERAR